MIARIWHGFAKPKQVNKYESHLTRALVLCGAIAGPLFLIVVLFQDYSVPGFDPRRHLLSQLSLGRWGWIQILNFTLAGVLDLFYAIGLHRRFRQGPAGAAAPFLVALYGFFLIVVGIFTTDPSNGFPPDRRPPVNPSRHAMIHAVGGLFTFVSLAAALAVLARRFLGERRLLGYYCAASSILMVLLFFGGIHNDTLMARFLRLATLVGWMAASVVAMRLVSAADSPA